VNICFFKQTNDGFGEEKLFETYVETIPSRKDDVIIDDMIYTVKNVTYCYDVKDKEPVVEVTVQEKDAII